MAQETRITKFTKTGLKPNGEQVEEFERYLQAELQAAEDGKGSLKERWDLNEQIDRNDKAVAGVQLYDNLEPRSIPSLSPRINRIVNVTVSTIAGTSVMVQAIPDDRSQARADALETVLQSIWERAGFERKLRMALHTAALCGVSVMRLRMTERGFMFDVIHPGDFFVAPTYGLDLNEAHLVGHRFFKPRWKVRELVKNKTYDMLPEDELDYLVATDPNSSASGRDPDFDLTTEGLTTDRENDLLELFELIVRIDLDGKPSRCRVVFSKDSGKILLKEPYPYEDVWYFDVRFHDEYGKWWPSGSIAQDVVGICLMKSDMFNLLAAGSMGTAVPPTVITKGSLGKKINGLGLGRVYQTPYDLEVKQIPMDFNPGAMPAILEAIDRLIESATGVTDVRLAAERKSGDITATQISAEEQAAAQNEGAYPAFASDPVEKMAAFTQLLITLHPSVVRDVYGESVPPEAYSLAKAKVRWQVTGRKPGNSPHILISKLEKAYMMSQAPGSALHPQRTEMALLEAMQLPINLEAIKKTDEEMAAEAMALQQAAIAQSGGLGGDGGLGAGMAQDAGMEVPTQPLD